MNKAPKNKQLDADILRCRADILRELHTISLHNDSNTQNPETQNNTEEALIPMRTNSSSTKKTASSEESTLPGPAISKKEEKTTSDEMAQIPSFDLAEEIMAEQRKITAIRRKAPGKNKVERLKPKVQPTDHIIEQPTPSKQDNIIAEIVARDIERLCRG